MAYQIEKTYSNFGGGISDDSTLGVENSVKDMDGIDIFRGNSVFADLNTRHTGIGSYYTQNSKYDNIVGEPTRVKYTPYGPFRWDISNVMNPVGAQILSGSNIDQMEYYGAGSGGQINYFIDRTAGIKKTDYTGTTVLATITSGYPTDNVEVTAVGWHQTNLLFSKENVIYFMTSVGTPTCAVAVTLALGTIIKCIYSYSVDSIVVVANNGGNTHFYELEFTGGAYNIVSDIKNIGVTTNDAFGDGYNVYFVTQYGLHQYQGRQHQLIKYVPYGLDKIGKMTFSTSTYNGLIMHWDKRLYFYGSIMPGSSNVLTKVGLSDNIIDIDHSSVLIQSGGGRTAICGFGGGVLRRSNYIKLLPIDGGALHIPKQDLNFRFGYKFSNGSYGNPETLAGINIKIQTDGMNIINPETYITIGSVTDSATASGLDTLGNKRYGYMEITPQMVVSALESAGYTTEFLYVNVMIELLAGNEIAYPFGGLYSKGVSIFDFTVRANFVKQ